MIIFHEETFEFGKVVTILKIENEIIVEFYKVTVFCFVDDVIIEVENLTD